jgi:hypothetical protein
MHARIATFEVDLARAGVKAARKQVESNWVNPPSGLETVKETFMLADRAHGRGLGITLYETEADLQRGHQALTSMSPPASAGRRVDVAMYEVVLHKQR